MANRDRIKNAVAEYNKRFSNTTFYTGDLLEIAEIAKATQEHYPGMNKSGNYEYLLMTTAIRAGYMLGYRRGQRDKRQR